jgi:hypothetical protein
MLARAVIVKLQGAEFAEIAARSALIMHVSKGNLAKLS